MIASLTQAHAVFNALTWNEQMATFWFWWEFRYEKLSVDDCLETARIYAPGFEAFDSPWGRALVLEVWDVMSDKMPMAAFEALMARFQSLSQHGL